MCHASTLKTFVRGGQAAIDSCSSALGSMGVNAPTSFSINSATSRIRISWNIGPMIWTSCGIPWDTPTGTAEGSPMTNSWSSRVAFRIFNRGGEFTDGSLPPDGLACAGADTHAMSDRFTT